MKKSLISNLKIVLLTLFLSTSLIACAGPGVDVYLHEDPSTSDLETVYVAEKEIPEEVEAKNEDEIRLLEQTGSAVLAEANEEGEEGTLQLLNNNLLPQNTASVLAEANVDEDDSDEDQLVLLD